ncbi:MAG: hypothetical protein J0L92_16660 [Deltaproteobacteria bacterium]|nr:hypothetical protein [Deltaproteobacteria bacterium]
MSSDSTIGITLREAYPQALARVLAAVRRLDVAEDALHDAVERALVRWPIDGMPESVEGWLVTVALNRRRDELRHAQRVERHADTVALALGPVDLASVAGAHVWHDDLLRLLVTACDPALSTADAAALALATTLGMTTREIARAFLVEERTMEQRLVRARRRLRDEGREYVVPTEPVAAERLEPVMAALYLLFTEGHWSTEGAPAVRVELCVLALDLARSLARIAPDDLELDALVATMLLHEARRATRVSPDGVPIPLPEQDRARWDRTRIDEAAALLRRREPPRAMRGPRRWEAEIALAHASARTAEDTDWATIAASYTELERLRPSPHVRVNRSFALARAHGPREGLRLLDDVPDDVPYASFVRAVLLAEAGELDHAREAFTRARSLTKNVHEQREIDQRLASLR